MLSRNVPATCRTLILCALTMLLFLTGSAQAQSVESGNIRTLINQALSTMPERDSNGFVQPDAAALAAFSQVFDLAAAGNHATIPSLISPYGYEFLIYLHRGNVTDTLYVLRERTPIQRGWGTYIWRTGGYERNVQSQVPHPLFDFNTPAIGIRAFLDHRMRFFLMAGTHRFANGDNSTVSDMARNPSSIFQIAHQRWSMAPALQVHGFNDANPIYAGYPQNIITNGTTSPPPVHYTVRDLLRARQYTAEVYDESTRDAVRLLAATQNPQGQWSAANNHVFLHIEMARDLRTIATDIGRVGESFRDAFAPLSGPMSGTFTVGDAGDYPTLGAAFSDLIARNVDGDVNLLITGDLTEPNNIFLGLDPGNHAITIRPAPGTQPVVRFTSPETNGSIFGAMVFGATGDNVNAYITTRNITIDGSAVPGGSNRDLTFEIVSTAGNTNYFRIAGDVRGMTVRNAVFRSMNTSFDTWFINSVVSSGTELFPQQLTFENNLIQGNPARSSGRALIVWGQNGATVGPRSLIVRGNELQARRYGIWLRVAGGSTLIENNVISVTETIDTDAYGLRFDDVPDATDEIIVRGNLISGTSAGSFTALHIQAPAEYTIHENAFTEISATGLARGIQVEAPTSVSVTANLFRDFTGDAGVEMVSVAGGLDGPADVFLANNRFTGFHSRGNAGANLIGVIVRSAQAHHRVQLTMYHNTIRMNPLQVQGTGWEYRGLSLFSNARIDARLRNNIILNDDTNGTAVTSYAYFQGGSAASVLDSDFNLWGGAELDAAASTWLMRHGAESTNTVQLSGFQQASGGDTVSAQMALDLDGDLRPDIELADDSRLRGVPLPRVRLDAFGTTRDGAAPTIGAYEFPTNSSFEDVSAGESPRVFRLEQNYPNPFNPSTVIGFQLAEAGVARLDVYDVLGRHVQTLTDGFKAAGSHEVRFDAGQLSAGVYMYVLRSGGIQQTRRMMLIK